MSKVKLAIFDVDYTITKRETLMEFFLFTIKKKPSKIFYLPLCVGSALLYAGGVVSSKGAKELFLKFMNNMNVDELQTLCNEFYEKRLNEIFYKDALNKMSELKAQGYHVCLISASIENYINNLSNMEFVDKTIGTRLVSEGSVVKAKIDGENCKGGEKINRLNDYIEEKGLDVDFSESYMFSDSMADDPLLNLVGKPYLINYKKSNPKYPVLKWV